MSEVAVQPLLQKLNTIERKLDSVMELQLEILERFLKETEPLEDEIEAIESEEQLKKVPKHIERKFWSLVENRSHLLPRANIYKRPVG